MFTNQFPYTNFHELNLDWLLMKMKENNIKMDELENIWKGNITDYVKKVINDSIKDILMQATYSKEEETIFITSRKV